MEIVVLEDKVNKLLDRREVRFIVRHDGRGTPRRVEVLKELAAKLSVEVEKIFMPFIKTKTGLNISEGKAFIFPNGVKISQLEPRLRRKIVGESSGEEKSEEES